MDEEFESGRGGTPLSKKTSEASSLTGSGSMMYDDEHRFSNLEPILKREALNVALAKDALLPKALKPLFDPNDPKIKEDIIRIIIQYLQDEGYTSSSMILQDEANVKMKNMALQKSQLRKMKKAILEGDWIEVEKLCTKQTFRYQKSFLYGVYEQMYLELINGQEYQKASSLLGKKLKPLESYAFPSDGFKDLCYLLTCKSVNDASTYQNWNGVSATREALVDRFSNILDLESREAMAHVNTPPKRLLDLIEQAFQFQVQNGKYHPKVPPKIGTVLEDYECFVLPNALRHSFRGHKGNIKSIAFCGEEGQLIVSGSSDNTVGVWDTETGENRAFLRGHTARVWDVATTRRGELIGSCSGDGSVRLWKGSELSLDSNQTPEAVLKGHEGDVYTVYFHPGGNHLVTGGYDKTLKLYDIRTGQVVRTFEGHNSSVSRAIFNPRGNLIISGSKDSTIKCWDVLSGLCVKTFSSHLGEVTSVELNSSGSMLLSSSKDNSNRLWDLALGKPIRRYKEHQNTSKNFIRSSFGPRERVIIGGSEDGFVYIWDRDTKSVVQKLGPCDGPVYNAQWNTKQSLLASCGYDGVVRTWCFNPGQIQPSAPQVPNGS
mmetsp:Transcript_37641/g.150106  ORF Transcript_37641/g.150106 Transcript_37641/m.150106 type:complete len:603 (-) Transcript_37641:890-2698(-)|eukprot:CAMPEP_0113962706 /NCGR_PEP_ID=MMETSP0011_2-20120614/6077_1 /TAXON_ID=101924 /ORGANISM="Rhodosorus marinus" /LENGTH=602 /DNA_ID=CAMNT_0000974615 /DNA_START=134 /DNA_END=1942 /DNA_ORIENTATION=- /assembly_acc=CAM_ASM_000156